MGMVQRWHIHVPLHIFPTHTVVITVWPLLLSNETLFQVIAKLAVFTVYNAHTKNEYLYFEKFLDRGSSASAWLIQNWWLFWMHIKLNHHFRNLLSLWILFILLDATLNGCFGVYYYCISHCLRETYWIVNNMELVIIQSGKCILWLWSRTLLSLWLAIDIL